MGRTVQIKVEPLTEDAFRPFGQLISTSDRSPDFAGINSNGFRTHAEGAKVSFEAENGPKGPNAVNVTTV